jgi:hypothetical protein
MNLHDKIMNLPATPPDFGSGWAASDGYKIGHRDARHAAADLALTADEQIRKLREALEWALSHVTQPVVRLQQNAAYCDAYDAARAALKETE